MAEYLDNDLGRAADEGKRLWTLVSQYARLEMVDKLTFILSGLLVGGVLVGVAVVAVFCLSMFCVTLLQACGLSQPLSYLLMALLLAAAAYVVLRNRRRWITQPLLQALLREFFPQEAPDPQTAPDPKADTQPDTSDPRPDAQPSGTDDPNNPQP